MTRIFDPSQIHQELANFFQNYATDALNQQQLQVSEALRRRHIPASKIRQLQDTYQISLKLGSNISLNSIKKQLLHQIEAVAYFLRDFQIAVLGQRTSLFHLYEIEIQVENNIASALKFEVGKLLIQLPYWQIAVLGRTFGYQELKTRWYRGDHLPPQSPVREVWWLFNPIGEFRTNLRTLLLLAVEKQILGIDKLFVHFGFADSKDDPMFLEQPIYNNMERSNFKDNAISYLKQTVNEGKIGVNLDVVLRNQDETTLVQLLGLFKKNLADPGQMEELIDAGTFTLQEVIQQEQSQVDIKMLGLVNIGNYHRVDVAVNLSSGYLKKYVELVPRKAEVKATLVGLVNVYTIDDITVKPNFHGAMKLDLETAALERSLRELQLVG